jgi:DNA helicase II / ATP-dependent DNA helicase PcrA
MLEELKKLNKEQLKAVKYDKGPVLVVAGAGTGKTTVLINRLAYLISEKKLRSDQVFLATFMEKAANEMIERAEKMLPSGQADLWINTFHGFGERILREHALDIGLDPDFKLLDSTAQWIFLKKNIDSFNLDYYRSLGSSDKFIKDLLSHFSRLKDEDIIHEDYENLIFKMKENDADELEIQRLSELSEAFKKYNQLLLNNGFLDFGDLINYTIKLFKDRPNILKKYQDKFKYLMIDEFQDTNFAQYKLSKILAGKEANLMVVGDDDQSIYKFRGASISNIMQFKDDYPQAKEIVLNENYRSRQEILDCSYKFIQNNNPNRLESKLGINKKLLAKGSFKADKPAISVMRFKVQSDEINFVANKIKEIYDQEKDTAWKDFAILSRSNKGAENYSQELSRLNIPNHFVSLKGLYSKSIVLNVISYFKLLDNYRESSALYRILGMEEFRVFHQDLITINLEARKNYWSLFEALNNIDKIKGLNPRIFPRVEKLLSLISEHSELVAKKDPSYIFSRFIRDSGMLKRLDPEKDRESFSYLNQFYQKIKRFEEGSDDFSLSDLVEAIDSELKSGDTGNLKNDFVIDDSVKVMTVHSSKGLEFKYVFLVDLVKRRFPSDNRKERIPVADALIKEEVSEEDDFHIEEERRLFYVALTRAKEGLFLTNSRDYGGAKEKRPSVFIEEAGLKSEEIDDLDISNLEFLKDLKILDEFSEKKKKEKLDYNIPEVFSFSQLMTFDRCPRQYEYSYLLKIPSLKDSPSLIFGRVIHDTLHRFLLPLISNNDLQKELFEKESNILEKLSRESLLSCYNHYWQDEGYANKEERDVYRQKGLDILDNFYEKLKKEDLPNIYFLEKAFKFKFNFPSNPFSFRGKIDRVDKLENGNFEIIDYKTGKAKDKINSDDRRQLILYKIVCEALYDIKVDILSYFYLEGDKISFTPKDKDVEKVEDWALKHVSDIREMKFNPDPSIFKCDYCDFRDICDYRAS